MRKTVVAVFAHPDDEAFGPGGTIAKFSLTHDVYLLCVTNGAAGQNGLTKTQKTLSEIRKLELLDSAKILGIKKVFFLGFGDGTLSNNLYHELASKIKKKLIELMPEIVITYEPHGVSGHIDHITVSLATTFVVKKLEFVKDLLYFCLTDHQRIQPDEYFIYFPDGYKHSEIDRTFDTSSVWNTKVTAMKAHKSQKKDCDIILKALEKLPKKEYFLRFKN